jgi:asparagine synthase (glutamine-hydrolysing)
MCGIIGQVSISSDLNPSFISEGLKSMHYRGPDDSNIWTSECGKVEFGHNRLSIIDLTVSGRQPFQIEESAVVGVFNGEI